MAETGSRLAATAGISLKTVLSRDIKRHKYIYIMLLPVIAYYIIFSYIPMYGAFMAFQDYNIMKGIFGSHLADYAGFKNFVDFFRSPYFSRVITNTVYLNFLLLLFGFSDTDHFCTAYK